MPAFYISNIHRFQGLKQRCWSKGKGRSIFFHWLKFSFRSEIDYFLPSTPLECAYFFLFQRLWVYCYQYDISHIPIFKMQARNAVNMPQLPTLCPIVLGMLCLYFHSILESLSYFCLGPFSSSGELFSEFVSLLLLIGCRVLFLFSCIC